LPPSEKARAAFRSRQARLAAWLGREGLRAAVLDDFEGARCGTVRWLCGQPTDAILVVFAAGRSVLVPWDVNMAAAMAEVDRVIPYADFKRSFGDAVAGVLAEAGGAGAGGAAGKVEFPARTSHLRHAELAGRLAGAEVVIRSDGLDAFLRRERSIKDALEVEVLDRAARITNEVIAEVEKAVMGRPAGSLREVDVAHMVEREALARGAEGLGFETLAAGPSRSWGIHCFPAFSAGPFGGPGLSILDFGVRVDGYTTDVTLTVARGPLSAEQQRMVELVEKAYAVSVAAVAAGVSPREPALRADEVFTASGLRMPHALGHGIGIDAHEGPLLRSSGDLPDASFLAGMVFTIEPGLYDPVHGGVRLENDVLITPTGPRVLTGSRIIRL
jgi:Xaa-Pro dipeptidase